MARLEVQDYKTTVTIKPTKAVVRERLGMPILLNTTGGTAQLLSPNPQDKVYSIDGTGLLGLFTTPNRNGIDYWILVSWFWKTGGTDVAVHDLSLAIEKRKYQCRWMDRPVKIKSLWDHAQHKMVEVYVNRVTMEELFEPYGGPTKEAKWLAGRLLPRKIQAALRLWDRYHLQLWIRL